MNWDEKKTVLRKKIEEYTKGNVCIAFSGGVDSSLLLTLACEGAARTGGKVYAVMLDTVLHPTGDVQTAKQVAEKTVAIFQVIRVDELENPKIMENPKDRCYLCKRYLYEKILDYAREVQAPVVIEGTNEDDLHQYRPGLRAVKELGIKSPLAECGFTKEEVRKMAGEYKISTASRPSAPCLATRLPYGTRIQKEVLKKIEEGEEYIRQLGYGNVRIRVYQNLVRLEVDPKDFGKVLTHKDRIIRKLKELGFSYVTLDLEGFRSGSMDL